MTDFVLYNAPQSTCSQRVRFVLNAKNTPFEEHKLDLFSGDQLKPEYLAINPNGVVPSIVHDGRTVIDSAVIMEYLDEVVPDIRAFTPEDPVERAKMRSMLRYIDEVPAPAIRVPSYNLAFLPHFQSMSEEDFLALANSKPLRKEFLLKMGRTGFPEEEMASAMDRLARTVARMDSWIAESGGPFFLGETISLADISLMPVIVRMDDINLHGLWADRPAIAAWFDAIRAHPAFQVTYYPGSLLTEKYPHLASLREERGRTA
jgi:glutathione S-transferase